MTTIAEAVAQLDRMTEQVRDLEAHAKMVRTLADELLALVSEVQQDRDKWRRKAESLDSERDHWRAVSGR
jgi:uncharacterized coiled-coil DUF342 family protein